MAITATGGRQPERSRAHGKDLARGRLPMSSAYRKNGTPVTIEVAGHSEWARLIVSVVASLLYSLT